MRQTMAAGFLQATSLLYIVAAVQIGQRLGALPAASGAALIAAGLAAVLLFPAMSGLAFAAVALALTVLALGVLRTSTVSAGGEHRPGRGPVVRGRRRGNWSRAGGPPRRGSCTPGHHPTLGIAVNLAYSCVAPSLFLWVIARVLINRPSGRELGSGVDRTATRDDSLNGLTSRIFTSRCHCIDSHWSGRIRSERRPASLCRGLVGVCRFADTVQPTGASRSCPDRYDVMSPRSSW